MVPLYQRKYQWTDKRLTDFWDDVEAKASDVLDGEVRFNHYMGALILAPVRASGTTIAQTPKVQVVDGQQRLTTFQIFLAALREVARAEGCDDVVDQVGEYLFNKPKAKDVDPLVRFKLTPTPSDRDVFHDIIQHPSSAVRTKYGAYYWGQGVPKNTPYLALRAYDLFLKWIRKFAKEGPSDSAPETEDGSLRVEGGAEATNTVVERVDALLRAVLSHMKLVVIELAEDDDAQVIFETLNSKGEPLLAMDLVRNNIFHRAEQQTSSAKALYKELWDPFDDSWWRADAPNARPQRPRIDHFLAHVLAAETGRSIAMKELYAEYRAFAAPRGRLRYENVEDELRVMRKHAPAYEALDARPGSGAGSAMTWLGRKLATWQVTTAYPVALQLAASSLPQDEQLRTARLLYSYIVRRAICDATNKNLNKIFQAMSQRFAEVGPSYDSMRAFFLSRAGESSRFPGDEEFRRGIVFNPAYQLAPGDRNKDILWELELASRTRFAERVSRPDQLWTEHVMPVSWNADWPFSDGPAIGKLPGDPAVMERNRLLHALGNLTLTTDGLNISVGNRSFQEKQKKYHEHTGLFLNKWFAAKMSWTETEIKERGQHLADMAVQIWPGLES
jgi:hypothetical protein